MSKFEKISNVDGIPKDIRDYLTDLGFTKGTPVYIGHDDIIGLSKSYKSSNELYITHIHISHTGVHYYKEYESGGNIDSGYTRLGFEAFDNLESFKIFVNSVFESIEFD